MQWQDDQHPTFSAFVVGGGVWWWRRCRTSKQGENHSGNHLRGNTVTVCDSPLSLSLSLTLSLPMCVLIYIDSRACSPLMGITRLLIVIIKDSGICKDIEHKPYPDRSSYSHILIFSEISLKAVDRY